MDDESGESMEPMEHVRSPLIYFGASFLQGLTMNCWHVFLCPNLIQELHAVEAQLIADGPMDRATCRVS